MFSIISSPIKRYRLEGKEVGGAGDVGLKAPELKGFVLLLCVLCMCDFKWFRSGPEKLEIQTVAMLP